MRDSYVSFADLQRNEIEGQDYVITWRRTNSRVLIMAPHGGNIELYTSEIANWIAVDKFSYYSFEGRKEHGARKLHITSHLFDEPCALEASAQADYVLTIHGEKTSEERFVVIGGLDVAVRKELQTGLKQVGFSLREKPGLEGRSPENICNRNRRYKGVQLELSYALRQALMEDLAMRQAFVEVVQNVLGKACGE